MADRPTFEEYTPEGIASQELVINDYHSRVKHRKGTQIMLLSGAVGSGKSAPLQNIIADIAITEPNSLGVLTRLALPDLRDTLFTELVAHLPPQLVESAKYTTCNIDLVNGSKFISKTFADNKVTKVRGLAPRVWAIEEITEFKTNKAFQEALSRMGRNPSNPLSLVICATNPDSPDSWVYRDIIANAGWVNGVKTKKRKGRNLNIHVYYSITTDNIYLSEDYKRDVLATMDPKMAERMIFGKWINLAGEGAYHAFDAEKNLIDKPYVVDIRHPIRLNFDFNTAEGKPMSACAFQYIDGKAHVWREWVVHKANTHSVMEEIVSDTKEPGGKGILEYPCEIIIHGDRSGRSNQSSATSSDYAIIEEYLSHYKKRKIKARVIVQDANPPIKDRVNTVNAYCFNLLQQVRLFVYPDCPTIEAGFKNTQWKKGADGVLDDSYYAQHVLDALGYGLWICSLKPSGIKKLW